MTQFRMIQFKTIQFKIIHDTLNMPLGWSVRTSVRHTPVTLFRYHIISSTYPSESVGWLVRWSQTLIDFHSVGVSGVQPGPSWSVCRPWDVTYFPKGMSNRFLICCVNKFGPG